MRRMWRMLWMKVKRKMWRLFEKFANLRLKGNILFENFLKKRKENSLRHWYFAFFSFSDSFLSGKKFFNSLFPFAIPFWNFAWNFVWNFVENFVWNLRSSGSLTHIFQYLCGMQSVCWNFFFFFFILSTLGYIVVPTSFSFSFFIFIALPLLFLSDFPKSWSCRNFCCFFLCFVQRRCMFSKFYDACQKISSTFTFCPLLTFARAEKKNETEGNGMEWSCRIFTWAQSLEDKWVPGSSLVFTLRFAFRRKGDRNYLFKIYSRVQKRFELFFSFVASKKNFYCIFSVASRSLWMKKKRMGL